MYRTKEEMPVYPYTYNDSLMYELLLQITYGLSLKEIRGLWWLINQITLSVYTDDTSTKNLIKEWTYRPRDLSPDKPSGVYMIMYNADALPQRVGTHYIDFCRIAYVVAAQPYVGVQVVRRKKLPRLSSSTDVPISLVTDKKVA